MPYVYQEYPKWIAGPEVIVQYAAEERCIRWRWSRDIGRTKANALQRSCADALALELAPEDFGAPGARQQLSRDRSGAQQMRPALGARRPLGGGDAPAALAPSRKRRCNRSNSRESRVIV
jgi:hypothetical protein